MLAIAVLLLFGSDVVVIAVSIVLKKHCMRLKAMFRGVNCKGMAMH